MRSSGSLSFQINIDQFPFYYISKLYNSFILIFPCILCMCWIKRNAGVNVVMQRKRVAMKIESPVDAVEVIFLLAKINMKIFAKNIGNLIESFQTAVIIKNGFRAAKGNA